MNSTDVPSYSITPEVRLYILFVMFIFSLVGNTLVIKQLLSLNRRSFPKSKVLFLNLAAADLFASFGAVLFPCKWELLGKQWKLENVLQIICDSSNLFSFLLLIHADRHKPQSVSRGNGHQPVFGPFFGFSNDLSKLNVIVLPTAPHFQEAKVSAVTNGAIEIVGQIDVCCIVMLLQQIVFENGLIACRHSQHWSFVRGRQGQEFSYQYQERTKIAKMLGVRIKNVYGQKGQQH
ncbi:gonadotropin-releasing hormone receptor [Caerostris extrusa]|uniref:Gonadotropin-releasing hormone receptor n=1 Tax=Caerostris extrusa TaxID=172846 RepID=A0AAV4W846_CAEEX|nr:gonadotropin-releasing hormone receptor [Caerostris extrusa]